ncbi:MAG: zinc ABC transporter substrate-binding protein [Chloroflexi bacterium]|nr:zinc ABC transporter substrate-binding protein [Chloroflexota bacterium]
MTRFFTRALGALMAVSLAAALVVGCSDDDPQQQAQPQPQRAATEQQVQPQQESEPAASAQSARTQEQQQQQQSQLQAVSADPLQVVVSTQVIADWVRQVGGDRVNVRALVPAGADAHILELSVSDIRAIAEADLVVINGAGLESYYLAAIEENATNLLDLTEAIEAAGHELMPFGALTAGHGDEHAHDDEEMHDDDHGPTEAIGRLLIADALEAHLSVVDLSTDDVSGGVFEIAAANASVYASPTHRYGIVIANGPEDDDDRIHVFDGGVFYVPHGDHFDLVTQPISRHALEIAEERGVHVVNSYGWTAIFADGNGHAILINEHDLANSTGDYEPIVIDAGPQHGSAVVVHEGHVALTTPHPDFLTNPDFWNILPEGVEVRTFDNELVFDAGPCPRLHGVAHNAHGAVFGCWTETLFLHAHDGEYESNLIPYPAEAGPEGEFAIGQYWGHHDSENFFGQSTLFPGGECCIQGGVWLVDVGRGEFHEVFPEPSVAGVFSSDGETFYFLAADGVLRAVDTHDGELIGSLQLVDPFEAAFGTPTPALIVVGEWLYAADPSSGHVLGVHLTHMEIEEEWHVGGAPVRLAFVGITDSGGAPHAGHDDHDDHEGDEHEEEGDDHGHHHHHGDEDPHFWFDADLASAAIVAIANALVALDPEATDGISDRLAVYLGEVAAADAEARALIESVPESQRLLVTFHDAFAYFARRYGLEIVGFLIEGPEQGISAETIAGLVELIEHEGVQTVFHEQQFDSSALDAVAAETGANRGIIWSQPTEDNPTYIGILLGNARAIAEQ